MPRRSRNDNLKGRVRRVVLVATCLSVGVSFTSAGPHRAMHNSYSRTLCYLVSSRENKQLLVVVYGPVAYQILKTSP